MFNEVHDLTDEGLPDARFQSWEEVSDEIFRRDVRIKRDCGASLIVKSWREKKGRGYRHFWVPVEVSYRFAEAQWIAENGPA
jgi:hypothetical protein